MRRATHPLRRAVVVLALLLCAAAPLAAQTAQSEADRAIAQLRSPYCPGLMLEVCPSPQAAALRDSIRDLAAEGRTADQLVEWMIARHGEEWRGVPRQSGRGLWAWIIPPLVLLLGAGLVAQRLRGARAERPLAPEPSSSLSEAERARVAMALRQWEREDEEDDQ